MIGFASFTLSALAFALLGGLILVKGTSTRTGRLFVVAIIAQVFWAICFASVYTVYSVPTWLISVSEASRTFIWTLFLVSFGLSANGASLEPSAESKTISTPKTKNTFVRRQWIAMAAAALCTATIFLELAIAKGIPIGSANLGSKIIAAVLGLWCIEQLYRNTPQSLRWAIKFLCIALAALFGYDMVMYTEALLFERVNYAWMSARGIANAVLVPLLAISAVRNRGWKVDIMVSRSMVLHSTTLLAAGVFLISMSTVGYYVRYFGGQWGEVGQALVLFIGFVALIVLLLSGQLRARLRVFVAKNFFSYRYDYREEWLALTRAFAEHHDTQSIGKKDENIPLPSKAILALGRFVESHEGSIWLATKDSTFRLSQTVPLALETNQITGPNAVISASDPFLEFMRSKQWVVVLPEMEKRPELYDGVKAPNVISGDALGWLVIPLLRGDEMIGFVTLRKPTAPMEINWEVRDILKTAARQTASYLAVESAVEELIVARQFESFNRMSAFVVHDLKNLVAQLRLLLTNAARHKNNPEFQEDMLLTVENVMERMQGLLMQLRAGTSPIEQAQIIEIGVIVKDALDSKKALPIAPMVTYLKETNRALVKAHPDRLARVIGHLVQNASEACGANGKILLEIDVVSSYVVLKVSDNGKGMSESFLSTQLFKPFESTKAHGMGIGTFESKEYVNQLGGHLEVKSAEDQGTTFTIRLPSVTPVSTLIKSN
jgi:putative PEP-CTERM system histidine kinase